MTGYNVEDFTSTINSFSTWLGGKVTYLDGYAVFTDPGYHLPIAGSSSYLEYSGIAHYSLEPGDSDFTTQSIWSSQYLPKPPGGSFGQYFYSLTDNVAAAMTISNFSVGAAELLGSVAGLHIGFTNLMGPNEVQILELQAVSIDPGDIIGDIIFQLNFDAESSQIAGIYSLDGGASFESPFQSYASTGYGRLYGDPVSDVPIPAAAWLFGSALLGLGVIKRKRA